MAALRRYLNNNGYDHLAIEGTLEGNLFFHTNGLIWDMEKKCPVSPYCEDFVYDGIGG